MSYKEIVLTGVVSSVSKTIKNKHATLTSFILRTEHYVVDTSGVSNESEFEYCVILLGSDLAEISDIIDVGTVCQVHAVEFNIEEMETEKRNRYVDDYIVATHVLVEKGSFVRNT